MVLVGDDEDGFGGRRVEVEQDLDKSGADEGFAGAGGTLDNTDAVGQGMLQRLELTRFKQISKMLIE